MSARDAAFEALYRAHAADVLAYCARRTSRDDAMDAASEVFVIALRKVDLVPHGDGALPWLYGVAANVLRNRARSGRRRLRLAAKLRSVTDPTSPGPEPVVVRNAEHQEDGATTTTAFIPPELDAEAAAVVEAMVAAINAGDVDTAVAPILEADEYVSVTSAPEGSDARFAVAGRWAYWAEIESIVELIGCTTTTSGTTRCEIARVSQYDYSSPEPELSSIQLRLEDGRVTFMQQEPITGPWMATERPFNEWVYQNHRDVGAAMFIDFTDPERSAELMREYYPLWLEQRGS